MDNLGQYIAEQFLKSSGFIEEQPAMEYDPPYHDLVLDQMGKIQKTAENFNLPIEDVQYAFEIGHEVVLSDEIWAKLENSKSYYTKNLRQVIFLSKQKEINIGDYINAIKQNQDLPLPMVLTYDEGKYWLVGGEIELSLYKVLGVIPVVLLANLNLKKVGGQISAPVNESEEELIDKKKVINEFIKFAVKNLQLKNLPSKITLSKDTDQVKNKHSFGHFDPNNKEVWVYTKNRNLADSLRTLAHELVHRKQDEDGRIEYNSGETGSEIENEANAKAGVLLRDFGKNHPEIYESLNKNKELLK